MTNVAFEPVADPPGLEIHDLVSKRQFTLQTSGVPDPETANTEPFPFPVEVACRIRTEAIQTSESGAVNVRDLTGELVAELDHESHEQVPAGAYVVEFHTRIKTYAIVRTAFEIETEDGHVNVSFETPTDVVVGARAHLRRPPTTVTTTRDLDDLRRAVETLSSSLQTVSPERSYPTLRGHPPRLELGDELSIPDAAEPPNTGIILVVPRELSELFAVASLSYYLGAALEFGSRPALRTETGFEFDLDSVGVDRVLKHVFLLDCLVRTHGLYRRKHTEYEALAPKLSFDLEPLYDATPAERLETYLSASPSVTEPHVPRWPSVVYMEPTADSVTALPYLVDDLALVRTEGTKTYQGESARTAALSSFVTETNNARGASAVFKGREQFVEVPPTAARHQLWVGDGIPLNAHKFVADGYEHEFDREPTEDQNLRVTVVCNDASMASEATAVESQYRPYTDLPFEVDIRERVTTDALAELLRDDVDFLHFIGHATEDGLECPDGHLDPASLAGTGVDAFLLNACQSYRHGVSLVERGSLGGIVTLGDVPNDTAIRTGVRVARLLNRGFSLGNTLAVARQMSVVGGQYALVGTGRTTLHRTSNVNMSTARVESTDDGYKLWSDVFLDEVWRLGSQTNMKLPDGWNLSLTGGVLGPFETSAQSLLDYFDLLSSPVWIDGELYWSDDVTREDLKG